MRLTVYLAAAVSRHTLVALAILGAVYVAVDMVEAAAMARAGTAGALRLYPLRLPSVAAHVLPLALLLGSLSAVGSLRRKGEWTALRAAGLATPKLLVPLLLVPALGAILSAPLVLELAPRCQAELKGRSSGENRSSPSGREPFWIATEQRLVRLDPERPEPSAEISIELDSKGLPTSWSAAGRDGDFGPRRWERDAGWLRDGGFAESILAKDGEPVSKAVRLALLPGGGRGLAGETLDRARLAAGIRAAKEAGHGAEPLEAQRALRRALIASCLLAPALGLLIAVNTSESRATRLILLGLAVAASQWAAIAAGWNGAVLGVWSSLWLWPGVAVLIALACAVAGLLSWKRATPRR
ncbi:MAG: LptF/LptG family permease [Polyangia bacterium]